MLYEDMVIKDGRIVTKDSDIKYKGCWITHEGPNYNVRKEGGIVVSKPSLKEAMAHVDEKVKDTKDEEGGIDVRRFCSNLKDLTIQNNFFRQVISTNMYSQLVLMSLNIGESIGNEVHPHTDQFFRIEQGNVRFILNNNEVHDLSDDDAFVVPCEMYHDVINIGDTPAKLYTIYSPPKHPVGTIHATKADADAERAEREGE
jgi:mannose-6-phosphate isomerase-like protein (cupin superfamily)